MIINLNTFPVIYLYYVAGWLSRVALFAVASDPQYFDISKAVMESSIPIVINYIVIRL